MHLALVFAVIITPVDPPKVEVPRFNDSITVNGSLDEPVWARAATLRGFQQYLPVDGRPAEDSTVVLVWYSTTAIHFGIRAYERHGQVRATLADRDKISGDDFIEILLDTFDDQRQAFLFAVNPLGIQADGLLNDASRSTSSFSSQSGGEAYVIDLSPDYVFQSVGRVTEWGYEVEVRIPFKSLRYQSASEQAWGINVIRHVQHSGYADTWSPVLQSDVSFLGRSGKLTGLSEIARSLVLDINPEVTSTTTGMPSGTGWNYDVGRPAVGGNARWGLSNNVFLNATVNPDFSQLEADVAQIQYDPRNALFFPEKRPFFLDGLEQFSTPNTLIYTRRLADPDGALKLTGKVGNTNLALLSGLDGTGTSSTGAHPLYNWLRIRSDVQGQSSLGLVYTDKIDGDDFNRVAAADAKFVTGGYTLQFQGGGSLTRRSGVTTAAPTWTAAASSNGTQFGFTSSIRGFDPDFRAASGFVSRVGVVHANIVPRFTMFGAKGAALESWTGSVTLDGTWDYDRFFEGHTPNDSKLHFTGQFAFRGGWRAAVAVLFESFKYPPSLYNDYYIERNVAGVVDTVPYTGTDRLPNLDYVFNLSTPQWQTFSASALLILGRDENFFEWASGNIVIGTLDAEWRPTEQVRVNLLYNHTQYIRQNDGSTVNVQRIPRLKVEYQLSRAVFVRVVGQYNANETDSLRDNSRTEFPILFKEADGTFSRAGASLTNDFRVDWLFSYRPVPGTVLFAGYGSSLSEPESFRFSRLARVNDGFFLKLSYLWRV